MSDRSVTHDTIVLERTYDAPPARVFAAWASPEARSRWAAPGNGWAIAEDQHDFRVGGREESRFGPVGDPRYVADTHYLDIVPERRIVMAGTMAHGETRVSASLSTVELLPAGSGTRLIYTEQAAFLDGHDSTADRTQGWGQILDQLGAELRRERAG